MNTLLVSQAVKLFVDTLPLEGMSTDDPQFHHLYSLECKLYGMMRTMSEGELDEYRYQVRMIEDEL
jgi:hypothetical protein